ncbi:hypothetical protein [Prauserella rugosa]|uniref:Uncharacterized protein n=1 Tax=Prauserella rugosa TaxID=43354 RepID=A0A660C6G5_9PSEU|nr:hypothetical protein [Prauserella rugosa]TWH19108.1 hypothetical protein JD82_00930 [Prauserella rugosa]
MRTAEVAIWVAVGLAAVALVAVSLAAWQLVVARRQAQQMRRLAATVRDLSAATQNHAGQAAESDESARDQARWAWEQVKLASTQLEQAQQENRASAQAEQWEWAYALTMAARELVDTSTELVRVALDTQVAPHYRQSAYRHYRQSCQRWQDTMIKALSRTSPSLEVQHQLIAFGYVHQRLHGHIDVLMRSTETGTLSDQDPVTQSVHALRHELANVHRQFQRTVSNSLATSGETELHEAAVPDAETRSIHAAPAPEPAAGESADHTAANHTAADRTAADRELARTSAPRTGTRQRPAQRNGSASPASSVSPASSAPPGPSGASTASVPSTPSVPSVSDQISPGRPASEQAATGQATANGHGNARTTATATPRQITGSGGRPPQPPQSTGEASPAPQGPPATARAAQARSA